GAACSAALASGILSEASFAASARAASLPRGPFPKDAVVIDSNEKRLGPCTVARQAISEIAENFGRYSFWLTEGLAKRFAAIEGLKPEYVRPFPGSGEPLHFSVLAVTSPAQLRDGRPRIRSRNVRRKVVWGKSSEDGALVGLRARCEGHA